ncbi:MAG: hypothetical protein K6E31_04845 [bacterium]|nr:hypothetical protein [bacterium]
MKGGILGGLGGLLGIGLLSKGRSAEGASILDSLAKAASHGLRGGSSSSLTGGMKGGCGGRGRHGRHGGKGNDTLADTLQQALQLLRVTQQPASISHDDAAALPMPQDDVIEIVPERILPSDISRTEEALELLAACLTSYSPGRARFRNENLRGKRDLVELQRTLLNSGFHEASFNASTGSALLTWDASSMDRAAFLAASLPLGEYLLECES